jgi:hypothetical protein
MLLNFKSLMTNRARDTITVSPTAAEFDLPKVDVVYKEFNDRVPFVGVSVGDGSSFVQALNNRIALIKK